MNKNTWKTVALMLALASVEANAAIDFSEGNAVAVCELLECKPLYQQQPLKKGCTIRYIPLLLYREGNYLTAEILNLKL